MKSQKIFSSGTVTDASIMLHGMHKGKRMIDVPAAYLIHLLENDKCDGVLKNYIEDNILAIRARDKGMPTIADFKDMMTILKQKTETKLHGEQCEPIEYPETPNEGIKLKIKDGYAYTIGKGVYTGSGGALRYVDIMRGNGISDDQIGDEISVDGRKLNDITWHKKP